VRREKAALSRLAINEVAEIAVLTEGLVHSTKVVGDLTYLKPIAQLGD